MESMQEPVPPENLIFKKIVNEKFQKQLKLHKEFIAQLTDDFEKNNQVFPIAIKIGKELALVYADFKCERCKATENLQFHHLIKKFYPHRFGKKYSIQRIYWANVMVLCLYCHSFIEDRVPKDSIGVIPQSKIDKLKERYKIN